MIAIRNLCCRRSLSAPLALLTALAGCAGSVSGPGSRPGAEPLRVAAASDLQNALPVVVEAFERGSPAVKVVVSFGASGQLAEQIKAGAPFDLLLAANEAYVRDLATEGYVKADSVRPYAVGALVLAVHRGSGVAVEGLADLARPEVKTIAIANPEFAPYGFAAKRALERSGLWEKVAPRVVLAESVRQALQYVQTGNAEAGLVSGATVNVPEVRAVDVDPTLYEPIVQSLGVVTASRNAPAAEAFARFLTGEPGRSVLASHGFKLPGPTPVGSAP